MGIASLVLGIMSFCGFLFGLVPLFGWYNWFNIPFASFGALIAFIGIFVEKQNKMYAIIGLVLSLIAIFIGSIRLVLGAGII